MSKEAAIAPAATAAASGKKKGKLIALIVGVAMAAAGAGGGYWYSARHRPAAQAGGAPVHATQKQRIFATLEPFTVNLRASSAEHFLQVGIVFEVSSSEISEAIKVNTPLIRGKILLLLSGKTAEDLGTPEGKIQLAAEVVAVARYALQGAPGVGDTPLERAVTDVHFSSMIIQ